jgi:hypothetical protein
MRAPSRGRTVAGGGERDGGRRPEDLRAPVVPLTGLALEFNHERRAVRDRRGLDRAVSGGAEQTPDNASVGAHCYPAMSDFGQVGSEKAEDAVKVLALSFASRESVVQVIGARGEKPPERGFSKVVSNLRGGHTLRDAETALAQGLARNNRNIEFASGDLGGLPCSGEVRAKNLFGLEGAQGGAQSEGLQPSALIERNIDGPLKSLLAVPVRFTMSKDADLNAIHIEILKLSGIG